MTDLLPAPGGVHEQLHLDIEGAGTEPVAEPITPIDLTAEVVRSPAYTQLEAMRDEAYGRRASGARAIARRAFAALQQGELTHEEHALLFAGRGSTQASREPAFEDLPTERPPRELDWAERAAGEGVHRPGEDE